MRAETNLPPTAAQASNGLAGGRGVADEMLSNGPARFSLLRVKRGSRSKVKTDVPVMLSLAWLGLIAALVLLRPVLPINDPLRSDYSAVAVGPFQSMDHPLGTDAIGRDMLARLVSGAGVSLMVGVGAVSIAAFVGTTFGLLAGYYGKLLGRVLSGIADVMLAFPSIVLLIAIAVFAGPGVGTIIVGIGIIGTPHIYRIARANTLQFASREFVVAAQGIGMPRRQILTRELLPNTVVPVLSYAVLMVAVAIVAEGGLSFLGLGVPPPQSSWGSMIADGRSQLGRHDHIVLLPSLAMFLTLVSLNFLGDYISKRFDIKEAAL